ncbi:uncharacterized protein LOC123523911 [Mercenaria mercenaria]|uniref:uncharacterized protein LOC123523911 n=1 Tax=Mercenaria mercenaria TaxID=6596 RepID=UPI00234FA717|nr:uncharacterized protein LOC123523911 [Mercenaria mercenaria]
MALMKLLYKHSGLRCPYEENGCRYVFRGKDKEHFLRHKGICRYGKRSKLKPECGLVRDLSSSFETRSTENEPKAMTATHLYKREENLRCRNRLPRGRTSPVTNRELSLPDQWTENVRRAQIHNKIERLEAENKTSEDEHNKQYVPRRSRYASLTYEDPEQLESDVFYPENSKQCVNRDNYPKPKVTEKTRALFRFKSH